MNIPVIAMTAHAMAGEKEKCLSYGMNEYISKPIREKELFELINDMLKTNRTEELLNLDYLKEVSGGNLAFEISMIEQFLRQAPGELEAMKEAFDKANYSEMAHIAHNFKTSVSFLGLAKDLDHFLNYIEINAGIQNLHNNVGEKIMAVNNICQKAFREAKYFLEHDSLLTSLSTRSSP
jgi:response regulator RpfG family c-di-GMP phosphodiesterase